MHIIIVLFFKFDFLNVKTIYVQYNNKKTNKTSTLIHVHFTHTNKRKNLLKCKSTRIIKRKKYITILFPYRLNK